MKSDLEKFFDLFPEPELARDLMTILEDYRINSRLKTEYPVLGSQITEMNIYMVSKRPSLSKLASDKQRAVELICQKLIAGKTKEEAPENIKQILDKTIELSQKLSSQQSDVHETARVTADVFSLVYDNFKEPYKSIQPFSEPLNQSKVEQTIGNFGRTARKINEMLKSATEEDEDQHLESDYSKESVQKLLKLLFKERGIKPKDIDSEVDAIEPKKLKGYLRHLETIITEKNELQTEPGIYLYDEWGDDLKDYRPNWTRLREISIEGGSDEFYSETIGKYKGLIKTIRREFQMLRPEGSVELREQFDGDDIDLDATIQFFIDKRLKITPSERIYTRTEKRLRDIATAFLIDISASTGGTTIECEKEALIVMSEALKELGDTFGIYAFSGLGRDNVMFYNIKDFDDPYDQRVQSKISSLASQQATRIAPAIRHTTKKLKTREEKTKLMIILSDGKPQDRDYYGDYAIEDTRMALKEGQSYGIKSFCITVDKESADYLPRMYSNSHWVVIDDVEKLPEKITRIYRLFTT